MARFYGKGIQNSGSGYVEVNGGMVFGSSKTSKDKLTDLYPTDPRLDKKRIEEAKGGLLRDAYSWILQNDDFKQWCDGPPNSLLWVRGDPGKGKTMLLCGIIDELENRKQASNSTYLVSFFFCQAAANPDFNNATAVLRGLIRLLVSQQPSLISHVEKVYKGTGKAVFEGANAWVALQQILKNILQEPGLPDIIFVIDALDECKEEDLGQLLDLITAQLGVKWIVSSRNRSDIGERLIYRGTQHVELPLSLELCLERNKPSISAAVHYYIQHEVDRLAKLKSYPNELRGVVETHLSSHSNDTFLWVALVCKALGGLKVRVHRTQDKLVEFPPGLHSLYDRMMKQIADSDDAKSCQQILRAMLIVYRPLSLQELAPLVGSPAYLETLIKDCGSFLALQEGTVSFIHQSAKDYLLRGVAGDEASRLDMRNEHHTICRKSLEVMSRDLRRDVYDLRDWSIPPNQIRPPYPDQLAAVRYSCIYWADHLAESRPDEHGSLEDDGMVHKFLREHYLHWLEALSIMESLPRGVLAISKLKELTLGRTTELSKLVQDAYRFIRHNMPAIETSPLQVYASALLFSPRESLVRNLFKNEKHPLLPLEPAIEDRWSACKVTFAGHNYMIRSLTSSLDGNRIASGSLVGITKIWDIATGACIATLGGHLDDVESVAFSHDGGLLASGSKDHTANIWDAATGKHLATLKGHSAAVISVAYSQKGNFLASGSEDYTAKIWNVATGECLATLGGHNGHIQSVAFSPDGRLLASGSDDQTAKIWDRATLECLVTIAGHGSNVMAVAFSPDGNHLATCSSYDNIQVWNTKTGAPVTTYSMSHGYSIKSINFDGTQLDWDSAEHITLAWDTATGPRIATFRGFSSICAMALLPNNQVASGSLDGTVKIWDVKTDASSNSVTKHDDYVTDVKFSSDGSLIASVGHDYKAMVWDTETRERRCVVSTDMDNRDPPESVRFSTDENFLITEYGIPLPISLPRHGGSSPTPPADEMQYDADEIQYDEEWIIYNKQKLVWLPHEYRFSHTSPAADVYGRTIAMGCPSGRVWVLDFSNMSDEPEEMIL